MSERVAALIAGAGLCASAAAQLPSFAYEIHAPATMTPGQTAMITVLCGFSPGIGSLVQTPVGLGPVAGLASGMFDLAGSSGVWTLGPAPNGSLIFPYNFMGTSHGVVSGANVSGVLWGNGFGPPWGTVSTLNPTPLWSAAFTAPAPGTVVIAVEPVGNHWMWAGFHVPVEVGSANVTGAEVIINVIPPPAGLVLIGFAVLGAPRRRRRRA